MPEGGIKPPTITVWGRRSNLAELFRQILIYTHSLHSWLSWLGFCNENMIFHVKKQLMVGQVGLEPTETEADGFTVRAATSYGILTHVLEIINIIFCGYICFFCLKSLGLYHGAPGRNRTNDTRIFSPLLYLLSYWSIFKTQGSGFTPQR